MTERTQPDSDAPGSSDPSKVHTFDLIDEVPGASRDGADPDAAAPDGADLDGTAPDGTAPDGADEPDAEPAPRAPGRAAVALAGARAVVGRTARRGVAAVRRRVPATRRGRVLLAGGTAAVVVVAVVAGVLVNGELRERALLATPTGTRSLAEKPTEQWSIDLENPISATLVRMPGLLAVVGDSKVQGLDPATGEVRWAVDLADAVDCGPTRLLGIGGPLGALPVEKLVCVTASEDGDQGVTVIDQDGVATTRELDPGATVQPAPDGGLIHLELAGGEHEQEPVVVDKVGTPHLPKGFVAPDLTVRVEDAATGAERWSADVPAGDADPNLCVTYSIGPEDPDEIPTPVLDLRGSLYGDLSNGVLEVEGCGISAAFLLDGTRLDDPADMTDVPVNGATGSFTALPDGGWAGPDPAAAGVEAPNQVVHLPDGEIVQLDGQVLVPWATDGRDPGLLLERVGVHTEGRSTDGGDVGARLWTAPLLRASALLARVAGTAVVVDELGPVRGIDLGTGAERWTLDPEVLGLGDGAWDVSSLVFGAWTDGDTLLLPASGDPVGGESGLRLVAIDLRDGSVRWEIEQDTPYTQLISVDGYLAQITQQGVVGLG